MSHSNSRAQMSANRRPPHSGSVNHTRAEIRTLVAESTSTGTMAMTGDLTLSSHILLDSAAVQNIHDTNGGGLDIASAGSFVHVTSNLAGDNEAIKLTSSGGITLTPGVEGTRVTLNDLHMLVGDIRFPSTGTQGLVHTGSNLGGNFDVSSGGRLILSGNATATTAAVDIRATGANSRIRLVGDRGVDVRTHNLRVIEGNVELQNTIAREIRHTGNAGAGLTIISTNGPVTLQANAQPATIQSSQAAVGAIHLNATNGGVTADTALSFNVNADTSINLLADAQQVLVQSTLNAGLDAIHLNAAAGGVTINSATDTNIESTGQTDIAGMQAVSDAVHIRAPAGGILVDALNDAVVQGKIVTAIATAGEVHLRGKTLVSNTTVLLPQNALQMRDQPETLTPPQVFAGFAEENQALSGPNTLTTPVAADIIAEATGVAGVTIPVGTSFNFAVDNKTGAGARTLTAPDGTITIQGTAAVGAGEIGLFRVVFANVTNPNESVFFIRTE